MLENLRVVTRRSPPLLLTIALATFAAGCNPVSPGLYEVSGEDDQLGAFEGTLEIRRAGLDLEAIRLVRLSDRSTEDGRAIELAWTGTVESTGDGSAVLRFSLTRADFIPRVQGLERTEADALPLEVTAEVSTGTSAGFSLSYSAVHDPDFGISESASFAGANGPDPIFVAERLVRETHDEPSNALKATLFDTFETYYSVPEVVPFLDHPAFQRAVHYQVEERTDFDYYRDHPNLLRVVNKVVDAIALAETEIRANAFRATLRQKADFYQQEFTSGGFLRFHGMTVNGFDAQGMEVPNGDGALWTGVHALTQAIRYRSTGSLQALSQVRQILEGVFTLMDITGDPTTFARTLREPGPPLSEDWIRGTGEFSDVDWRRGGNNDMSVGLMLAFVAAMDALPPNDPLWPALRAHAAQLLELCVFRADTDIDDCEGANPLLGVSLNPATGWLIDAIANDDATSLALGLDWLRQPGFDFYAGIGGGPFYIQGISDWSGNHLTLAANLPLIWLLERAGDAQAEATWKQSFGPAWEWLEPLEHPLHAATAVSLSSLAPGARDRASEQARWGLRSFPFPKHRHPVDHSIRGDFVLSPYPSLPWKDDWETNLGRQAALVGHGIVESSVDSYFYNGSPTGIRSGGIGDLDIASTDYLFLYWLARDAGIIGAND